MIQNNLIDDKYFNCEVDENASSRQPEKAIWLAQNVCVNDNEKIEIPENPGNAVCRHQLNVGHFSVLNFAFFVVRCSNFDHNTVVQMCRHRDSAFLVRSQRYTGNRFLKEVLTPQNIEKYIYIRPVGTYFDRNGNKFEMTPSERRKRLMSVYRSVLGYRDAINKGESFESARYLLPSGFRQNFTIAGTLENYFHWLDQRTKKDSQLEIQTLAWMILDTLKPHAPNLIDWYLEKRAGKAKLAP